MKRLIPPIVVLAMLMFACNISTPTTPPVVTQPPVTVPVALTETAVIPTVPPALQTNTTCNQLALYLDPTLASSYTCETIPENSAGMEITPQYTKLSLQGYLLADKFFTPSISVFPVQRFSELLPDFIPGRIKDLQALIEGGPAPVFTSAFKSSLPFLPIFNAAQVFFAMYQNVSFVSGGGIRYITLFAQYSAPVNNHDLFYTYQGLSSDGQNWVSAILPINNPVLPADAKNPPNGQTWDQFSANFGPYITDMTTQLNALAPDSYTPTFSLLDTLVSSITIQP